MERPRQHSSSFWTVAALVWRVPLALLSLMLFKATRFVLRRLINLHFRLHPDEACRWRAFSAENLNKPLALAYVMTNAPRLNLHAIAAGVGPLRVEHTLSVDVAAAASAARSWSLVIYTVAGAKTVASVNSQNIAPGSSWHDLDLPAGRYAIVLRYYDWSPRVTCPAVRIDGHDAVPALALDPDVTDFYRNISRRRSWPFYLLHDYMFTILRYRAWLPEAWVAREFLPVGNPDTCFQFGVVEKGNRLAITLPPELLGSHDCYLTLYDRASFPREWSRVTTVRTVTLPAQQPCMYLLRVHPRDARSRILPAEMPAIEVEARANDDTSHDA